MLALFKYEKKINDNIWLYTGIAEILGLMIGKNSDKERKEKKRVMEVRKK
jgi:hypothetical protein